ncbi:berberine bridge enzyme-like 26 [Syzygium oleosum]|uniref:berberine bridge enzyme-like 26 n=1 Tax=Syzygium oleosum TaxID=219896 RepID=UPI0024BB0C73|nr:berberine bridge enzyme-like 26 [Syzygium oleosum]
MIWVIRSKEQIWNMLVSLQSHNSGPNRTRTMQALFSTLYLGGVDALLEVTKSSFPELNVTTQDCTEMSWIESILYFAGFPIDGPLEVLLNRSSNTKLYFKDKSDYVKEPIPDSGLEGMWERFFEEDDGVAQMIWIHYGGKMSEISESALPFPHRAGVLYKIQHLTSWTDGGNEVASKHVSWIRSFYSYMAQYVSKSPREAYINYRDLDIGTNNVKGDTSYKQASAWGKKYFKNNFDRPPVMNLGSSPPRFGIPRHVDTQEVEYPLGDDRAYIKYLSIVWVDEGGLYLKLYSWRVVDPKEPVKEPPMVPPVEPQAVHPLQAIPPYRGPCIPPGHELEDSGEGRVEDDP